MHEYLDIVKLTEMWFKTIHFDAKLPEYTFLKV